MSDESRCINHPFKEAAGRCKQCNIPICNDCKIFAPEGVFCSEKCLTKMRVFMKRAEELNKAVVRPRSRFPVRTVLIFLIIVAAVIALLRFRFGVQNISDFVRFMRTIVNAIRR